MKGEQIIGQTPTRVGEAEHVSKEWESSLSLCSSPYLLWKEREREVLTESETRETKAKER